MQAELEANLEAAPTFTDDLTCSMSYHVYVTGSSPVKAVTSASHDIEEGLTIINKGATVTISESGQSIIPAVGEHA